MPYDQEVNTPTSPDLEAEKLMRNQGDIEILDDNLKEEMHNISFDKSQHRVLHSHRVTILYVHTYPT